MTQLNISYFKQDEARWIGSHFFNYLEDFMAIN